MMPKPNQIRLPLYKQIYATLRDELNSGLFDGSDKLPSEKELSERFRVERNTLRKALQILVDDGMIVKVPGYGAKIIPPGESLHTTGEEAAVSRRCILLTTQENYLQNPNGEYFHLKLIRNLERNFTKLGYNLIFKSIDREESLTDAIRDTIPAAIIFDSYNQSLIYKEALQSGLPCISVNHYTPLMTSVVSNNFDGAYHVAKMLTDAGHSRIAFITGKRNYQTTTERLSGIHRLYMQRGVPLEEKYIFTGNWQLRSGVETGEQILAMAPEQLPTAVFAFNDDMAFGCLSCFEKHGLSVPDDISIVGFDKSDRYQSIFRPITTVDVNITAIAEYACWYLSGRIANTAPTTNVKIDIDATIVDNGTVRRF